MSISSFFLYFYHQPAEIWLKSLPLKNQEQINEISNNNENNIIEVNIYLALMQGTVIYIISLISPQQACQVSTKLRKEMRKEKLRLSHEANIT